MRILIFSAFEPIPSDEFHPLRYAYLAEELARQGHYVDFIGSSFFHMHKVQRIHKTWYHNGNPDNLALHLIPAPSYKKHTGLKRLFSYFMLARNLKNFLKKQAIKPDLIVAAYPPVTANKVLAKWAKQNDIPFVMDIQDVWPFNFEQLLPLKAISRALLYPLKKQFRYIVKQASAIVPVSEDYFKFAGNTAKNKLVKNFPLGADSALFPNIKMATAGAGAYRLLYVGNASTNTMLYPVIEASAYFKDALFHFIGLGNSTYKLEKFVEDKGFENIRITPWLPPADLAGEAVNYDAAFLIVNPKSHIAFPYKAYTYWMAGLPVISNIRHGEVERLIRENNLGVTIRDDSAAAIEDGIMYCKLNFDFEDRQRIQKFARENFDVSRIYRDYSEWLVRHFGGK